MLLTQCYPGRVVTYWRNGQLLEARITGVTHRGNVRVRVHTLAGKAVRPFHATLPPERIDGPLQAVLFVEQTEPR